MTDVRTTHVRGGRHAATPEELETEVARLSSALAQTVDRLHGRLDVRARTREKVHDLRGALTHSRRPRPVVAAAVAGTFHLLGAGYGARRVRR